MTANGGKKRNYFVLDGNYDNFYFITNDHYGETLLRLLCNSELIDELNAILAEDLNPRDTRGSIENDAMDENGEPVLFAYSFDMPRIKRFDSALGYNKRRGTAICFDFQAAALKSARGDYVTIQTIDFEKFERRFFS
jgi:hypothetical protein